MDNSLIIMGKQNIDVFLQTECPTDCIGLYMFYCYMAKCQRTSQPKCTTDDTAKGLRWSAPKVRKVKKILIELGLIEDKVSTDDSGKITGHYIKLNYIIENEEKEVAINGAFI